MGGNIETITDTVDNWKYDPDSQEQIATGETATQGSENLAESSKSDMTSDSESSQADVESEQTVSLEDIAGQTTDSQQN